MSIARTSSRRHFARLVFVLAVGRASSLSAQETAGLATQSASIGSAPIVVTAAFDEAAAWIPADSSITLTLSRVPLR